MTNSRIRLPDQHADSLRREELLMEFAVSDQEPMSDRLGNFISAHPQFGASFARLATELEAFHTTPEGELTPSERSEQEFALRMALEVLEGPQTSTDPLDSITPEQLRGLGETLNASRLFITRLKDRTIDVGGMTEGFLAAIASVLSASVEQMRDSLAKPHRIAAGVAFKAKGKPEAGGKQSFEEALRTSGLRPDQQDHLRGL